MRMRHSIVVAMLSCFPGAALGPAWAQSSTREPTADQAKNDVSDRDIMQKIRKAIMADKSLSAEAHNVKVIARNGQVTLRGFVRSEEEKTVVAQKAAEVAGVSNVTNDLIVKSEKEKS